MVDLDALFDTISIIWRCCRLHLFLVYSLLLQGRV